jgi:hypothetical protein
MAYAVLPLMNYTTAILIGRRQTGKTTFLVQSALEKIYEGAGIALFDPYSTATELILSRIPEERYGDVVLCEPDRDHPFAFNSLYNLPEEKFSLTTDAHKHTLKGCWDYTNFPTPTMDDILTNGISAVLYSQNPTLVSLKWFLTNSKRREKVLDSVEDIAVKDYWTNDFASLNPKQQIDETRSTLTKVRAFTTDPITRNILGQHVSRIVLKNILDQKKILIVDVGIGKMGIEASKLLGSLLMSELHQAALSYTGKPFYCYIDGANRFAQSIQVEMAEMPSGVSFMFSLTHLGQIEDRFKKALFGASDIMLSFTTGLLDGQELEPIFYRGANDNVNNKLYELEPYEMCIAMNDGSVKRPHAKPLNFPVFDGAEKTIRHQSREKYTRPRKDVEAELKRFIGNSL